MARQLGTFVAGLALLILAGGLAAAAAPEDKLPANASLVLLLDKPSEAAAKWQKTAIGSMLLGKEFQPLYAELQKGEIAAPLNPKPALGLDWADVARFNEPAAFAILAGEAKKPALVFLSTGKADAGEVKRVLVEAEKYFDSRKAKRTTKKEAGADVVTYELPPAGGREASVCVHLTKGELFAATNSVAAVDQLLKLWEAGDKGSLLNDPDFVKVDGPSRKAAGEKSADVRWFIRPLELAELVQPLLPKKERGNKNWVAIARREGVDVLKGCGGAVALQPDKELDLELAGVVVAKRPYIKGMRIANLKPADRVSPPDWVESTVGSFFSWSWDFTEALAALGDWTGEKYEDPGFFDAYLSNLRLEKQVDVKKDVTGRLGPTLFAVGDAHGTKDKTNAAGTRFLVAMGSKEQDKLFKAIVKTTRDDEKIKDEKVGNATLRYAPENEPLFTESADKSSKHVQAAAVTPTHLIISTDTKWLRSKLAGKETKPLLTSEPAYKLLAAWQGKQETKQTCLRGFLRGDQSWRSDYDLVRSGGVVADSSTRAQMLKFALLGSSPAAAKGPGAALPTFDAVAPQLMPSGLSMAVSPDGFDLRAAVLRKE